MSGNTAAASDHALLAELRNVRTSPCRGTRSTAILMGAIAGAAQAGRDAEDQPTSNLALPPDNPRLTASVEKEMRNVKWHNSRPCLSPIGAHSGYCTGMARRYRTEGDDPNEYWAICETCDGEGSIWYHDVPGQGDVWDQCPDCDGYGYYSADESSFD